TLGVPIARRTRDRVPLRARAPCDRRAVGNRGRGRADGEPAADAHWSALPRCRRGSDRLQRLAARSSPALRTGDGGRGPLVPAPWMLLRAALRGGERVA